MWEEFEDLILRVLLVAGIFTLIVNMIVEEDKSTAWLEGVAIILAVFTVLVVSAW